MELQMFVAGTLIEALPINQSLLDRPGYINGLQSDLEEKYEEIIDLSKEEPLFFIDKVPSRMNFFQNSRRKYSE